MRPKNLPTAQRRQLASFKGSFFLAPPVYNQDDSLIIEIKLSLKKVELRLISTAGPSNHHHWAGRRSLGCFFFRRLHLWQAFFWLRFWWALGSRI